MQKLCEELFLHDELNDKLFDVNTKMLFPEVRDRLLKIADAFIEYLDLNTIINVVDIWFCGSNAAYNYVPGKSDIDLHIIYSYNGSADEEIIMQSLMNAKKTNWNNKYGSIKVKGSEVELYGQHISSGISSNGIYSVCDNKWVKEPEKPKSISKPNVEKEVEKWVQHITNVLATHDRQTISDCIDALYLLRLEAISTAKNPEYSEGNVVFKDIRNLGLLQKLKDELDNCIIDDLTLESIAEDMNGSWVSRYNGK